MYDPYETWHIMKAVSDELGDHLKHGKVTVFAKTHDTPRLIASVGKPYTFSGVHHKDVPFKPVLHGIMDTVKEICGKDFNSALINLYRDGKDYIGAHRDNEGSVKDFCVATLSLGTTRNMVWRLYADKKCKMKMALKPGSIVVFGEEVNTLYTHEIPKQLRVIEERMSITFRHLQ